jgi:hypothetical protein
VIDPESPPRAVLRGPQSWVAALGPIVALAVMVLLTWALLDRVVNAVADPTAAPRTAVPSLSGPTAAPVTPAAPAAASAPKDSIAPSRFDETRGRLTWSISILFAVLAIGGTFSAALVVIGETTSEHRWSRWLLLAIPALLYTPLYRTEAWRFNKPIIDDSIYHETGAKYFVTGVESLAYSTLIALAVAVGCVLFRTLRSQPGADVSAAAAMLARHQRQIRLLLYTGAAALVAGTLEVSALYTWAVQQLPATSEYAAGSKIIPEAMGWLAGSFYSILLAAIFVPTFSILRYEAEHLADKAKPNKPAVVREKWLVDHAIATSIPKQFVSAIAVLAPLIAGGPLSQLLELIGRGPA